MTLVLDGGPPTAPELGFRRSRSGKTSRNATRCRVQSGQGPGYPEPRLVAAEALPERLEHPLGRERPGNPHHNHRERQRLAEVGHATRMRSLARFGDALVPVTLRPPEAEWERNPGVHFSQIARLTQLSYHSSRGRGFRQERSNAVRAGRGRRGILPSNAE